MANDHTPQTKEDIMSRNKTVAIDTNNVGSWVTRKRRGRMIRKQHTVTAKWSPWMIDGEHGNRLAERAKANVIADARETMGKMTVAELKALAGDRGVKVASKARKADIIAALTDV